jgi:hypothetical protein
MKYINIKVGEEEFAQLYAVKEDRTWGGYIMKDVMN